MSVDLKNAQELGFPKPQYMAVERERRWLCRAVPREQIMRTEAITDLYVAGTQLRLREARPLNGGAPMLRLTRKADVDIHTRLITSIYLPEEEFRVLSTTLHGTRITKFRHRLHPIAGLPVLVDEFQGELAGLILAEAEFATPEQLAAYPSPDFVEKEVTEDLRYSGGQLIKFGRPR